ncbi:acetaldehyde dehydrogenase (acetylating) [Alteribacter natronophilus]|uniref:acetaldehyde dehydrogenase (acetylating) n=1 Tax=Alteribacter natronophilus TaxID=2583810 RepID=UPI00110E003E|nr:acetaldehyde dehydrogenase (acetylating) [Alteribacter natronophilus]TMW70608.1 acetaldehyde dehydrogenase (acetylating) [Alteribacter natronophilus]
MEKVKVGIIGSGNIGTDLLMKLMRSKTLEVTTMIGIDRHSDGLKRAKANGLKVIVNGIDGFLERPELADILFDATSAKAHFRHVEALEGMDKQLIDLTPAAAGPSVVPSVNMKDYTRERSLNLITCGGQATIPIVHAVNRVSPVDYAEIAATIASKSAGPGTRANIDEFTITTRKGIEKVGGAKKGKAIIILNPAEPPIMMRDTIYCEVAEGRMKEQEITDSIYKMVNEVQKYVPGYRLRSEPVFDKNAVTVFAEVEGAGDYLETYAGNLDIMTAAAVKVAEELAEIRLGKAAAGFAEAEGRHT